MSDFLYLTFYKNLRRNKMSKKDELDEIFVDINEPADKKIIVEILKPFIRIDKAGVINFLNKYHDLKEIQKSLIYLICKKAMILRGIKDVIEPALAKEISKRAMINLKSAENSLYRDHKSLVKKEGKGYIVPNYNLQKIKELLQNGS
jgi:hypothetical protein